MKKTLSFLTISILLLFSIISLSIVTLCDDTIPGDIFTGQRYVKVDINSQHLYVIDNSGDIIFNSPVTTGKKGCETNLGIHKILKKSRNVYLKGKGYKSFVKYWMKFDDDAEGFHDASWRDEFGTDHWLEDGSHGCVNMPSDSAKKLYDLIDVGTLVYIY